jgi:hypothetical protein
MKVARGGSWSDRPKDAGSTVRFAYESYQKVYNVGFRVVVEDARDGEFALAPVAPVVAELEEGAVGAAPTVARVALGDVTAKDGGGGNSREGPRLALDGDTSTKWYHGGAKSTWVQCKFPKGAKRAFGGYNIVSGNDCPSRDPADWRVQGSDDGKSWTTLDERKGEKFTGRHQLRRFTFKEKKPFNIYRLCIDKSLKVDDGIQLSEFQLTDEVKANKKRKKK